RHEGAGGDIWITDVEDGNTSRLTFDPAQHNNAPIFSRDGTLVAFSSFRNGSWGLYQKSASGLGVEELLLESKLQPIPMDWTRDGQTIVFDLRGKGDDVSLWRTRLDGDRTPVAVLQRSASPYQGFGHLSADGRWITYASFQSGKRQI